MRSTGKNFFLILGIICLFSTANLAQTSLLPIKGWAKNSVNSVIFRKNSVVTHGNTQYTAYYNGDGFVVLGKRELGSVEWETKVSNYKGNVVDAHNSISIMIDGDGFLHMAWDHHNNALNYCKSTSSASLDLGSKVEMIGTNEGSISYPEFHRMPNGDLLFMYRDGGSGNGNLVINFYNTLQKKWERLHNSIIDGEGNRNAYWQTFLDSKGTIHISWVWRESPDVASNHDLCYAKSEDGGRTWKKSDGTQYSLPIVAGSAEYALRIPEKSNLINQTSMYGDLDGNPYICSYWTPAGTGIPQYHIVYHNGSIWQSKQVSDRITPFSLSGGGTKKIPVSRPQVLVEKVQDKIHAFMIYRDVEQGDKVSLLYTEDLETGNFTNLNLTDYSTGSWEPSFDTELWKKEGILHIFVQHVGQGDGETLENLDPQDVTILEFNPQSVITNVAKSNDDISEMLHCSAFPNPFSSFFTITLKGNFSVTIFNTKGEIVEKKNCMDVEEIGQNLKSGLYAVKIESDKSLEHIKIIKQ